MYGKIHTTDNVDVFNSIIRSQDKNKRTHSVLHYRNSKTIYIGNKPYMELKDEFDSSDSELTPGQFKAFIGAYKRSVNKYILNNGLYVKPIELETDSIRKSNPNLWHSLNAGDYFFNVDIRNCYWQMSHRLGYIDTKFYLKYLKKDEYKQVKRLCVTFLAAPKIMEYTTSKGEKFTIECDNTAYTTIYANVRYSGTNIISACDKVINGMYIEKNIDAITVKPEQLQAVKDCMISLNVDYKTFLCQKINDYQYKKSGKIRNFINPLKKI